MSADLRVLLKNYPDRIANFSYRVARFDARHPDMKYTLTYEDSPYEEGDLDYDESVEPDEQEINPNWVHAGDLTGWLWTELIERISQDRRS